MNIYQCQKEIQMCNDTYYLAEVSGSEPDGFSTHLHTTCTAWCEAHEFMTNAADRLAENWNNVDGFITRVSSIDGVYTEEIVEECHF